jgi:hypothetical protein
MIQSFVDAPRFQRTGVRGRRDPVLSADAPLGPAHGQRFRVLRDPRVQTSARKAEWFSLWQHLALLTLLTVFPCALRSRRLCGFWYRRPGTESNGGR